MKTRYSYHYCSDCKRETRHFLDCKGEPIHCMKCQASRRAAQKTLATFDGGLA